MDTVYHVMQSIKSVRPKILYIVSDGPNENKPTDLARILSVRDFLDLSVDWSCVVKTRYRRENMGLKYSVKDAIDWFFEREEYGIILEDDTVPNLSFYHFMEYSLLKYRDSEKIMMISGNQFLDSNLIDVPYYFSSIFNIWGWATWRRAWKLIDLELIGWDSIQRKKIKDKLKKRYVYGLYDQIVDMSKKNHVDSWAYSWSITGLIYDGLSIVPSVNLVSNIGRNGTHSKESTSKMLFVDTQFIVVEKYQEFNPPIISSRHFDSIYYRKFYIKEYLINISKSVLRKLYLYNIIKKSLKIIRKTIK